MSTAGWTCVHYVYRLNLTTITNEFVCRLVDLFNDCMQFILARGDPHSRYSQWQQLADVKASCFNSDTDSVWSCDKTYKVGKLYMTATVYRNMSLQRVSTGDIPIFIGPVFVHGNSDFDTYAHFFGMLAARLNACDIGLCSWEHLNDRWSWRHATIWSRDARAPFYQAVAVEHLLLILHT